jgi:phosphoribosyl-dephospho-CoA transferase
MQLSSTQHEEDSQPISESLEERLKRHPELKVKIETLLSVVENAEGDVDKANAAEQRMVEEIQQLGQAALQTWANRQNQQQTEQFIETNPQAQRTRKKNFTGTPDSARLK